MKKNESIIRTLKFEESRFRFKQLRKDLFFDRYILVVMIDPSNKNKFHKQLIYINQHIGREYSFPGVSFN